MVAPQCYYQTSLEEELKRYPGVKVEDIEEIRNWISSQPHLPQLFDVQIVHFLHASYYDIDVAKKTIEKYFTYKTTMTEFFSDWDPESKRSFEYADKVIQGAFLPKQSPSDSQIILLRLNDPNVDLYSFNLSVKWLLMSVTSLLLEDGQQMDFKIVYDATGYSMSHVMRNPLSSLRNYLDFGQKASAIRVVEIHFINSSSIVKKMIAIVKPFMNKHIMNMLSFHTSAESFFKNIPKEVTPSDYGGTGPAVETLHMENIKRVMRNRSGLLSHSEQKTDENKRIGKKKKVKIEQEFKKLEID